MQAVSQSFHDKSQAGIRRHRWSSLIAFDKDFDDDRGYFILDTSELDGPDIITPVGDNPIQYWDFYEYTPYTDRIISLEWEKEVDFPYSVHSFSADATFNNFDNLFSSRTNSPLAPYLSPGRPIKVLSGYEHEPLLQQFVGLTQGKPELDQDSRTARFEALDYLSEIFKLQLSDTVVMENVRTDEVIAALFQQFGIESFQYDLERGRNRIPFLFFEKGKDASECFREIMQAEGGQLWIDEQGIIKFRPRLVNADDVVISFNESNISSLSTTGDTEIINRVTIKSNIRAVQDPQVVHAGSGELDNPIMTSPVEIPPYSEVDYIIDIPDPLAGYSEPTLGQNPNDSWFTVKTKGGGDIASGVSVVGSQLTTTQLRLTFSNSNGFDALVNAIEVYGEPAKIVDTIDYEAFDQDSIDEYGEHILEIENDMFGSEANCESFAYTAIDAYSQFDSIVEMSVKGDPSLQLNDIIDVSTRKVAGQFQIIKISNSISPSGVTQIIRAKRYTPRHWFILDISLLNGEDVLAP